MIAVLQRVKRASVEVECNQVSSIDHGFLILLGVMKGDSPHEVEALVQKIVHLRVFADGEDRMNLSITDCRGQILVVSQFTLAADCRKGRRPSFTGAMEPEQAKELYRVFCEGLRSYGIEVSEGEFGANMQVTLINDGPVTLILDSTNL